MEPSYLVGTKVLHGIWVIIGKTFQIALFGMKHQVLFPVIFVFQMTTLVDLVLLNGKVTFYEIGFSSG